MSNKYKNGFLQTPGLPPVLEMYRRLVLDELYTKFNTSVYKTVCWATEDIPKPPDRHRKLLFFPGEEYYARENHMIYHDNTRQCGTQCALKKRKSVIKAESADDGVVLGYADSNTDASVRTFEVQHCSVSKMTRPLLCRMRPFAFRRVKDSKTGYKSRAVSIVIQRGMGRQVFEKYGSVFFNQLASGMMQSVASMWAFLDEKWWRHYERETQVHVASKWKQVTTGSFALNEDVIQSKILGARQEWRTELLAALAVPACPVCTGTGLQLYSEPPLMVGMQARERWDLCKACVLPALGFEMAKGGLVDPHSSRILMPDGTAYRGDRK